MFDKITREWRVVTERIWSYF